MDKMKIMCGANSYEKKFYLDPEFEALPQPVKDELKIMCVSFVQDVGGIFLLQFDDDGNLQMIVTQNDDDFAFDEIGCEMKIRQFQTEKEELFRQIETYYDAVIDDGEDE